MRLALVDLNPRLPSIASQHLMPRHDVLAVGTAACQAGHEVSVFVESLNGCPFHELLAADVVGASVTAPNLTRVRELFQKIHKADPRIRLIAGGPHATLAPTEVLRFCDVAVREEGEETIVELLDAFERNADLSTIRGISFAQEGTPVHNARRPFLESPATIEDLALLRGFRRRSLLRQLLSGGMYCGYAVTSRGCPFPCTFCYENMIGGTGHRMHSVDTFIADVRQKIEFFGTRRFWLADSNFATNPRHAATILQAIIEADLGCEFTALCRVEIARHPKLLELMRKAGVVHVSIGMEAIDDATLVSIEKRQTVEVITRAIATLHAQGISVFGLFMVGFDTDTSRTPQDIVDFCETHKVDGLSFYCLTEYPSLPGRTLPRSRICEPNLDYYTGHFVTTFPLGVRPSVLEKAVYDALLRFYGVSHVIDAIRQRDKSRLAYLLPLYVHIRKLNRLSLVHRKYLSHVERGYYDDQDRLILSATRDHPVIAEPLAANTLASWIDPDEIDAMSSGPVGSALPILNESFAR